MTTKKNLVKLALMSTLTAGIFSFSFALTSCSDDELDNGMVEPVSAQQGDYSNYEPYGLTYHNFDSDNDVQILNADTTEIAVKKSLADKLGITNFENHPLGIWDSPNHMAYGRKGLKQELVGDTYIIKVGKATTAELIGDKAAQISTDLYVNEDAQAVATRAAEDNIPDFAAKYVDDNNKIHPAVILYTDAYGYDKDCDLPGDQPSASATRAAQSGEYQYVTAEELLKSTRASIHPTILSLNSKLPFEHKIDMGDGDSISIKGDIPVDFCLNYFLTLNAGIKWAGIIPYPAIKKFETGFDGNFGFHPEFTIGFSQEFKLPKDKEKVKIGHFKGYTFTFMIGVIPVAVTVNPNLYLKFDASVTGSAHLKCEYDYSNWFKAGVRYDGDWHTFSEFEEIENEFTLFQPELEFTAGAGVGLYLAADVKIYDVAGPEIGVGPHLGAEASIKISPKGIDWNAEVKLKVQAWAGAKIEILGYELAEWHETFNIVGPWTLLKFPSDGSEHKCEGEVKKEKMKSQWDEFVKVYNEKYDTAFINRLSNVILMNIEGTDKTYEDGLMDMYSKFDFWMNPKTRDAYIPGVKVLPVDINNKETRDRFKEQFDRLESEEKQSSEKYWRRTNWDQIKKAFSENGVILSMKGIDKNWSDKTLEDARQAFNNKFNREPKQTKEDISWLLDYYLKKVDAKIAPDLKKHQGIINTVKTCDKLQSLMKTADYNSMALNYAIWVTMKFNYDINQLKAGVKDAKMEKFADCINAYYITTLYNYK